MVVLIIALAVCLLIVGAIILLRRAGGGRFPWMQFYLRGRESGFSLREINLIRRVAVEARLEEPTALFWSVKQLDRAIKAFIIKYRSYGKEQDPEYHALLGKLFELRQKVEFELPRYKLGIKTSRKIVKNQILRVTLPGTGPFRCMLVENLPRYMAFSYPQGPKLPEGFNWRGQKIGVYFWRAEDAGYYFQTRVLEDFSERKYPILHVAHGDNLVRAQRRSTVRAETDLPAELYPLRAISEGDENPETGRGLRCRIMDLSVGGLAVLIGGKAKAGLPVKLQFSLGDSPVVLSGVVKSMNFDQKKNRSLLHVQATPPSLAARNRIQVYVFNLFGEREAKQEARPVVTRPAAAGPAPEPTIDLQ
jgi:c-di-GMP-binding flagellar brake protein YcgR